MATRERHRTFVTNERKVVTAQRSAAFFVGVAAAVLLIACSSGGGSTKPDTTPTAPAGTEPATSATVTSTAPEEALGTYVQRRLSQGFVADCDKAKRPDDVGKQCAKKLGERHGLVAYKLGPTFGDYTRIMILEQKDGGWTIARQETHDPNDPDVPGIPWPLEVGAEVVVVGTAPDCLKVRQQPSITGTELDCLKDGETVKIVAGPTSADDIEWWQLEGQGWAASNYLRYPDAGVPEPTVSE
jgi:hypothetical protein